MPLKNKLHYRLHLTDVILPSSKKWMVVKQQVYCHMAT